MVIKKLSSTSTVLFIAMKVSNNYTESHFLLIDESPIYSSEKIVNQIRNFKNSIDYDKGYLELKKSYSKQTCRFIPFRLFSV